MLFAVLKSKIIFERDCFILDLDLAWAWATNFGLPSFITFKSSSWSKVLKGFLITLASMYRRNWNVHPGIVWCFLLKSRIERKKVPAYKHYALLDNHQNRTKQYYSFSHDQCKSNRYEKHIFLVNYRFQNLIESWNFILKYCKNYEITNIEIWFLKLEMSMQVNIGVFHVFHVYRIC